MADECDDLPIPTKAELCLLFCCIYSKDSRLPVEDLVIYGMTLKLFEDVHNMIEARCRLHGLIKIINHQLPPRYLNKLCLWEDYCGNQYVEVLDLARDLVTPIVSKYQLVFGHDTVMRKWPNTNKYEDLYGLSLVLERIRDRPIILQCPKLALLELRYKKDSQSIPVDFLEGMKDLRFLSLDIPSLPQSLNVQRNLRTLHLKVDKLEDVCWIRELINLEILSISTASSSNIPRGMGQLGNLRLLDLRKMKLAYIPPGVLSRMLKLEELYLPLSFSGWGLKANDEHDGYDDDERINANISEIDDGDGINASLNEIGSLPLNVLQISVPKASVFPKKSPAFENSWRFKILAPNNLKYSFSRSNSTNELQLTGDAFDIAESGICVLTSRTEYLSLTRVTNLKNVMHQLEEYDFLELKKLIISECDELEYVIDTKEKKSLSRDYYLFWKLESLHLSLLPNLKEIWQGRQTRFRWFENLSRINIRFCHKLRYVFPLSIVRGLRLLKCVEILGCFEMEGIFYQDEDSEPLVHYSIEELDLHSLPKLVGFLVHKDNIIDDTDQSLTTNEVSLIQNKEVITDVKMYCAFPSKLAGRWFQNLKRLKVAFCDTLEVLFLFDENHFTSRAFNSLKELELFGLRNLIHIWFQTPSCFIGFQNLQLLILSDCHNLLYLFSPRVAKLLVQLQKVYINHCEKMKVMVTNEDEEVEDKIVFPQLKLLELEDVPNLRIFSSGIYAIELPSLETLKFNQCYKMKSFSYGSLETPMLKKVHINGSLYSLMGDLNANMKRYMENCSGTPSKDFTPSFTISINGPAEGASDKNSTAISCAWIGQFRGDASEANPNGRISEGPNYMKEFAFADLKIATKNFSSDNLLVLGYFGEVYKGWLDEKTLAPSRRGIGMEVAIKKWRFHEWQSELKFLQRLSHPNLVQLLGHCCEEQEVLFVYEYMHRGSLDCHLFRKNSATEPLSWDMRLKIATGAARGLAFLHSLEKAVRSNFKASNILLDNNYNAKLSNFGLPRLGPSYIKGGPVHYASPLSEGPMYKNITATGSDVYSFGTLLLELMTGLRAVDTKRRKEERHLDEWLKPILTHERQLKSIMDTRMEGNYSSKAMLQTAQLASKCIEWDPESRPSMRQVVEALDQITAI